VFEDLPEAVLAAIVIHAVSGMVDISKLRRLWKAHVQDFWLALGALVGVVTMGILAGIVLGVGLSLFLLLHRMDHPNVETLGRGADGRYESLHGHPEHEAVPGVLVCRPEAPLIFANADVSTEELHRLVAQAEPRPTTLVLDFEAVAEVDTTGSDALIVLRDTLHELGVEVRLARVHRQVRDYLDRDGFVAKFGDDRLHATVEQAVAAAQSLPEPDA
jgi:MFS superfamily sulfate permease-like transporter